MMTACKPPLKNRLALWCALITGLAGFGSARLWAQGTSPCAPASAVKAALGQVPSFQIASQTDWQFHELMQSALQPLLQRYPDDVFVQRAYVRFMLNSAQSDNDKIVAEYKALHEKSPDDARVSYLYGMTLAGHDTPQAIKLFTAALDKQPDFPWPHLSLVNIYSSPNFLDKAKVVTHETAFLSACPASLEGYSPLARMDDHDLIQRGAAQLRQILQPRRDAEALGAYSTLWSLEFKVRSPEEYDSLRKQVATDLDHIRALSTCRTSANGGTRCRKATSS